MPAEFQVVQVIGMYWHKSAARDSLTLPEVTWVPLGVVDPGLTGWAATAPCVTRSPLANRGLCVGGA